MDRETAGPSTTLRFGRDDKRGRAGRWLSSSSTKAAYVVVGEGSVAGNPEFDPSDRKSALSAVVSHSSQNRA
jgi:hypothetical protein